MSGRDKNRGKYPAEAEMFLKNARRAFLFSVRADGLPTCHPMTASWQETGNGEARLVFNTYRASAKARNLMRNPRAATLVLPDWQAPPSEALAVEGEAEEVPSAIAAAAGTGEAQADAGKMEVSSYIASKAVRRVASGKRVLFALVPGRVRWLRRAER